VPFRIGLFGGTFDPPHLAHLVVATHVRHALALDEVVLMVANDPYQKTGGQHGQPRSVTPADVRLELVRAAVRGVEGLRAGDDEIDRGGPSYTVDTVEHLRSSLGDVEIFVVIGEDAARGFDTWHRYEDLARLSNLVVVNRSTTSAEKVMPAGATRCEHVTIPYMDISSSDIRRRVRDGESIDFLVRRPVRNLIETQHLYADHQ
jgi:nicotinate-nucleotide adenylyltransferase